MAAPVMTCPRCGSSDFEPGFVDDAAQGRVRWFRGPMELGPMGNAKRTFRDRLPIVAARCRSCFRLELFALDNDS